MVASQAQKGPYRLPGGKAAVSLHCSPESDHLGTPTANRKSPGVHSQTCAWTVNRRRADFSTVLAGSFGRASRPALKGNTVYSPLISLGERKENISL